MRRKPHIHTGEVCSGKLGISVGDAGLRNVLAIEGRLIVLVSNSQCFDRDSECGVLDSDRTWDSAMVCEKRLAVAGPISYSTALLTLAYFFAFLLLHIIVISSPA